MTDLKISKECSIAVLSTKDMDNAENGCTYEMDRLFIWNKSTDTYFEINVDSLGGLVYRKLFSLTLDVALYAFGKITKEEREKRVRKWDVEHNKKMDAEREKDSRAEYERLKKKYEK